MNKEILRMQMLSGVITESEYIATINQEVENTEKDSLNEHYVAGGIVGIGAINQIPSRAKADYEDAFEYFLSQKYSLNEMEKEVEEGNLGHNEIASLRPEGRFWIVSWRGMDGSKEKVFTDEDEARAFMNTLEEGKEVEEPSLYEAEVNENVGSTIEKILQTFEFSEKGNDEMIEFANYLLSPEGPKNIASSIKSRLKGEGGENYFTSTPDELNAFLSKLQ